MTADRPCLHQRRFYDFDYRTDVCHDCGFRNDDANDYWQGWDAAMETIKAMGILLATLDSGGDCPLTNDPRDHAHAENNEWPLNRLCLPQGFVGVLVALPADDDAEVSNAK